jgi:hypothetical protein
MSHEEERGISLAVPHPITEGMDVLNIMLKTVNVPPRPLRSSVSPQIERIERELRPHQCFCEPAITSTVFSNTMDEYYCPAP